MAEEPEVYIPSTKKVRKYNKLWILNSTFLIDHLLVKKDKRKVKGSHFMGSIIFGNSTFVCKETRRA